MNTADWGRRFQDMATDASTMYSHVLARYNELLRRVAAGELPPENVQNEFRDYLQESGSDATRELIELSVGLLAGLLYVEAKYREALLDGLLPSDGPVPPPPSAGGVDLTNWFQTLAAYANAQSRRGMGRYQQLVERVAAGQITPEQMRERGQQYLASQAPHFVGEVLNLGMDFVSRLQQSSTRMAEGMYDRVLGEEPASQAAAEMPLVVNLRGSPGATAQSEIVVENSRLTAADVVCELSGFTPRDGGPAVTAAADVTPARFRLSPGEERDVAISLALDPELFRPGADYFALLRISGVGSGEILVQVVVHSDKPASAEPRSATSEDGAAPAVQKAATTTAKSEPTSANTKADTKSKKPSDRKTDPKARAKEKSSKTKARTKSAKSRSKAKSKKPRRRTTRATKKSR